VALPPEQKPVRNGAPRRAGARMQVAPMLVEAAAAEPDDVPALFASSLQGLSRAEAERRLVEHGPNVVGQEKRHTRLTLLGHALLNPLVILLAILATVEYFSGDYPAAMVMTLMVVLGVGLRFLQEARADTAAARLKAMITVTATALRDGKPVELPLRDLVPGDVIQLSAGDMIPADVRLLSCKDLFIIQSTLTGESLPVEKFVAAQALEGRSPLDLAGVCYLGTTVESGAGMAIVAATGPKTCLGGVARAIVGPQVETSFDKGISQFTWLMIRFMLVMVPLIFLINGITKHDWREAFFFALAVAVGMTPEMLPMIVTVCLSKGAIAMSRKKVIVKRLNSIQNFGAMDVLCTDKTGTLTLDRVILEKHFNVMRENEDGVLVFAYLNSYFQTGLKNVLDRAILDYKELHGEIHVPEYRKLDEIPFDFSRKVMSVVVETPAGAPRMLTKGAPEQIFKRCSQFEYRGKLYPMEQLLMDDLRVEYEDLSDDGFRVLALAYKDLDRRAAYSKEDERDMILRGFVAFLDPPKDSTIPAIVALQKHGVSIKVLTGDNERVSAKICREVGLDTEQMVLGAQLEGMDDVQLADAAERATLFARLSPADKERVIRALQSRGHVVGYLGDGINDAQALRAADVGISVDTAVDLAKESADMILLEKSLMVLEEGVLEGRKVFANILKYVRMGASSSFGNMFSVVGASVFLPYVPMMPIQILTNNLLYDFSQVAIPTDDVDVEQSAKPRRWTINEIARFILCIGPISSIFDYSTYFIMLYVFNCWDPSRAALFQTGWFVESLLTQTLIIHIIRTNRIPFLQSRASWPLIATTVTVMAVGIWLPISPVAESLGFQPLPGLYWPLLFLTLLCYGVLTQSVKMWLFHKRWV